MIARLKQRFALPNLRALGAGQRSLAGRYPQLRLPRGWPELDAALYWYTRPGDTAARAGRAETSAHVPSDMRGSPVHVWTPPTETLLTHATIPTRSRARIMQALPFALEDQLLDEPEQLHFAYVREADNALAVAITQRARLDAWLDGLKTAGVRPASMCPANLALPLYPNAWSLAFVDDELWVRTGEFTGFVGLAAFDEPPPLLQTALKEAAAQTRFPQQLIVFRPPPALDTSVWSAALKLPVVDEPSDFWQEATPPALNLLQTQFAAAGQVQQLTRPLRPAMWMLAILLVGTFVVDVAEWARLRFDHRANTSEMRDIFLKSFPEAKTVLDPFAQMQKNLDALQSRGSGPADLLPLLTRIAPALQAQQTVKLQGIKYAERSVTLDLLLPDFQAVDAMKNTLQGANLDVEVLAANGRGAGQVEGRLRVQPAGSKTKAKRS